MRKLMIAPSVGCCDLFHIEEQFKLINEKSDFLHMDIKDGVYVPSYGIGPDYLDYLNKHIKNLKPMDAHLMVKHPQQYLETFAKAGAAYITPHTDCIEGDAQLGKSIVILGGGTIGLMVLQACKSLGATDITVVDIMQNRLDLALKLGASRVINGKEQDTVALLRSPEYFGDHGCELVFEAAGSVFTAQQAVQIVARGGKIMMVGTQSKPVPIDFLKINREVTIQTSFRYCNNFPQTIEAIATGKFNVKDMVTNVYDYKDVQQAFMDAIDPVKKANMVKGVIKVAE